MKTLFAIKVLLLIPLLLFVDYVVMILFGGVSNLFGCSDSFYCGPYCTIGKLVLGLSVVIFLFLTFQEIKVMDKTRWNGPTAKE